MAHNLKTVMACFEKSGELEVVRLTELKKELEGFEKKVRKDLAYYIKHSMKCCDNHPTNAIRDYIKQEILAE